MIACNLNLAIVVEAAEEVESFELRCDKILDYPTVFVVAALLYQTGTQVFVEMCDALRCALVEQIFFLETSTPGKHKACRCAPCQGISTPK